MEKGVIIEKATEKYKYTEKEGVVERDKDRKSEEVTELEKERK